MKKKEVSTQDFLGVRAFSRNGIQTDGHGELVYFTVKPTNISVLSRDSVAQKIHKLTQFLSAHPDIEIVCMDARENFDTNKLYLEDRKSNEPNRKIRELLDRDSRFLDDIQFQMSTAREFLMVARLRNETDEQSFSNLNQIEKDINGQGFDCTRGARDDVKRILSRYFGVGMPDRQIDDTDGVTVVEKWFIPD
ncbi:MAG: hypothetical protein IKX19_01540 [Clostridia bacterium]|nr:hypothetical protein [Clostridia bacterium]